MFIYLFHVYICWWQFLLLALNVTVMFYVWTANRLTTSLIFTKVTSFQRRRFCKCALLGDINKLQSLLPDIIIPPGDMSNQTCQQRVKDQGQRNATG